MSPTWKGLIGGSVIGLAVGAWWSPRPPPLERVERAEPLAVHRPEAHEPPRAEFPIPTKPASTADSFEAPLAQARALVELKKRNLAWTSMGFASGQFGEVTALDERFKEIFNISPEEEDALVAAITDARARVTLLELSRARVVPGEGEQAGALIIEIPSFAELGGPVHDQFIQSVRQVLGDERYALAESLMGNQLDAVGNQFGAQERRVVIRRKDVPGVSEPIYEWDDHYIRGDARGHSGSRGPMSLLRRNLGPLAEQLVPPDL